MAAPDAASLQPRNLLAAFDQIHEYWSPKVIGRVNDQYVKIAKLHGTFTWHAHDDEDELFHVLRGTLRIEFEDHVVTLGPGDMLTVPKGVRHNPVADQEVWVMLIETVTTKHTGNVITPQTRSLAEQLS